MSNLLDTPKLGFGCMRLPLTDPKDQKSIDIEHLKKMVDAFIEAGGTYFDTAYVYHEGESEVAMRKALVERYPRDSFTIATKCLAWAQPTAEDAKACLDTSLKRLGTDYIDFYLLHNMGGTRTAKFDEYGRRKPKVSSSTWASRCMTTPKRWTSCSPIIPIWILSSCR